MAYSHFTALLRAACAALLVVMTVPVQASPIDDAIAAANTGDFAGALATIKPLARRGHPDDRMQQDMDARMVFVIVADRLRTQLFNEGGDEAAHQDTFTLAYEIARDNSDIWGMRYYLGRMYIYAVGSTVEQAETGVALLESVAASGDAVYAPNARATLCEQWFLDYCE